MHDSQVPKIKGKTSINEDEFANFIRKIPKYYSMNLKYQEIRLGRTSSMFNMGTIT
jgi:hypothetical protein